MLPFPQLRQSALIWVEQKATVVGGQLQVVGMHYALCTMQMHYALHTMQGTWIASKVNHKKVWKWNSFFFKISKALVKV